MAPQNNLATAILSFTFSLVIIGILNLNAEWFVSAKLNIVVAGFIASWIFIFSITAISNIEMLLFGQDFQARFIPEIIFCLTMAAGAGGLIHRVTSTTCILFSIFGLYFINKISSKHYNKSVTLNEQVHSSRRSGNKKK